METELPAGSTVYVAASLPAGTYTFCIVLNGVYLEGQLYAGATVACIDVELKDAGERIVLPPTEIWASAEPGSYDLLALDLPVQSGASRVVGGHSLGAEPGLIVFEPVSARISRFPLLVVATLVFLSIRRRSRREPDPR